MEKNSQPSETHVALHAALAGHQAGRELGDPVERRRPGHIVFADGTIVWTILGLRAGTDKGPGARRRSEFDHADYIRDVPRLDRAVALGVANAAPSHVHDGLGRKRPQRFAYRSKIVKRSFDDLQTVAQVGQTPRLAIGPQQDPDRVIMVKQLGYQVGT